MNTEKTLTDSVMLWLPIIVSIISALIAYWTYLNNENNSKQMFKNMLRENVKKAKHKILELQEKVYSHSEQIIIMEIFRDLLFYQGYRDEKNKCLTDTQNRNLSKIQEEIEDFASCIFANCDIETNKNQAKESLNSLLALL